MFRSIGDYFKSSRVTDDISFLYDAGSEPDTISFVIL